MTSNTKPTLDHSMRCMLAIIDNAVKRQEEAQQTTRHPSEDTLIEGALVTYASSLYDAIVDHESGEATAEEIAARIKYQATEVTEVLIQIGLVPSEGATNA